ncbi:hypothetical protein [Agathobaculum sp.]|uniref:hypothetical protein n=1 Tax=Agathobaculum sp. TaxID=2048138 RepID=UPI002A835EC6|nr:hypothetical protein [Agathobaculum sp.]MDY3617851.1 hypothetical protein [Agathobaculum sp.]
MADNYRVLNLEDGMPTARQAIGRLLHALENGRKGQVIKLIHGYGSSGTGGVIRVEVRRKLERLKAAGQIAFYVPGEKLSIFDADTRRALDLAPALRADRDLERHNNGVTILVL